MPVDLTRYPRFKGSLDVYDATIEAFAGPYKFVARLEDDYDSRPEWEEGPSWARGDYTQVPFRPHRPDYPEGNDGELAYLRACAQSLQAFNDFYDDAWRFVGVVIDVYTRDADDEDEWVLFEDNVASLWGIENADYPDEYGNARGDAYLVFTANELGREAYRHAEKLWLAALQREFSDGRVGALMRA